MLRLSREFFTGFRALDFRGLESKRRDGTPLRQQHGQYLSLWFGLLLGPHMLLQEIKSDGFKFPQYRFPLNEALWHRFLNSGLSICRINFYRHYTSVGDKGASI